MPLTADHYADVAVHWTIAGVAVWQVVGWMMVAELVQKMHEFEVLVEKRELGGTGQSPTA